MRSKSIAVSVGNAKPGARHIARQRPPRPRSKPPPAMADRSKKADKPLECPVCHGTKVKMGGHKGGSISCAECGTLIAGPGPKPKARVSAPGTRHRSNNGPAQFLVTPVDAPTPAEIGPGHHFTTLLLEGGERGIIAAEHEATRLSEKFGEEIESEWCLATTWLKTLTESSRERARYALQWRPRFLAIVSLTRSVILGSRGARVAYNTVKAHRRDDVEFDAQVLAAQDRAVELLHDMTFRDAVEGWMEPVFWQGIRIGSIRKFDNRLRIEMLRAHMPRTFKTPGQQTSINIAAGAG